MKLNITKEWFERHAELEGDSEVSNKSCFCIGPQKGQPLCPCAMRMRGATTDISSIFPASKGENP